MRTLYVLQYFFLCYVYFLNVLSDLLLPEFGQFIEGQRVFLWIDEEGLVQCSWVIHSFDGEDTNIIFLVEDS